jgi:hypothetical protein
MDILLIPGREYVLDYTNYRGERALRQIELVQFAWATRAIHSGVPELLLVAKSRDRKDEIREFAVAGIHSIRELQNDKASLFGSV